MNITFIAIGVESLAIEMLSSYVDQHGHHSKIIFDPRLFNSESLKIPSLSKLFDIRPELIKEIKNSKPDIIGFSVFTINYQYALEFSRLIKKKIPNIPIIFGGIHSTSVPEIVIKEKSVDMVCIGEGEEALNELLSKPKRTNIKNIWFKKGKQIIKNPCRPLIKNLDSLPFPNKDLFYKIYPGYFDDYYTISSRGCPFNCTYCANNIIHKISRGLGPSIRRRSPKNIVDELSWAKHRYHIKKITFVDDVFVQDIAWLKQFARLYKQKVDLPYAMLTHPSFITDDIAKTLAKSGCYFLLFGIQSASQDTRRHILNRFETNSQILSAANSCHKAHLKFSIDHIFNIPGEGAKQYEEALIFYQQLRPSIINAYWLQYFPKAEIIKHALRYRLLTPTIVDQINHGQTTTSLIVGLGSQDSFNPKLTYANFQFLFMLLPILPPNIFKWIASHRSYFNNFQPLIIFNILLKFYATMINNRFGVYLGIIKGLLYFSLYNLKIKLRYRLHD